MRNRILKNIVRALLRYYGVPLILGLSLGLASVPRTLHLFQHISTDPLELLPDDYPSVQALTRVREKSESKKRFTILAESARPENTKRLLEQLKLKLQSCPEVGRVSITKPGYEFFKKYRLLFLEVGDLKEIKNRLERRIQESKFGPFLIRLDDEEEESGWNLAQLEDQYALDPREHSRSEYFESPNGLIFAAYLETELENPGLSEEKAFQEKAMACVREFDLGSAEPSAKLHFSLASRILEYNALIKDIRKAGIISGILIFLPLLIRFRRLRYVGYIFFPLLIGIPISLALASFWVPRLNVTTAFLFAILGGLGVESGIHLFYRYYDDRRCGRSMPDSILDLYRFLVPPILTSVASLGTIFGLMSFNDFKGFKEFGIIAAIGLGVLFVLYFTFFPALLIFAERIGYLKFGKVVRSIDMKVSFTPGFSKALLVMLSGLILLSAASMPFLQFEYDTKKIRADDPETRLDRQKQRATASRRANPAAVIIHNKEDAKALDHAIQRKKSKEGSLLDKTASVYSLVPEGQNEKMQVLREIRGLLADKSLDRAAGEEKDSLAAFKKELEHVAPFDQSEAPQEVKRDFLGKTEVPGSLYFIFTRPGIELDHGKYAMALADEVETIVTSRGEFRAANDPIVFAEVFKTMLHDAKKVLLLSVLCLFFFVYLEFQDLKKTCLILYSIFTGILLACGAMFLLGIKFNLYNLVMIPVVMGMSVDNGIHLYHRYRELGPGSMPKVLSSTGVAVLLASTTNAAGFIGLVFCTHGGLRAMGMIAVIGLITCLVTTLLYLPAILQTVGARHAVPQPSVYR